jgi:hypothetical protein
MKDYRVGSKVIVRLHDGTHHEGIIKQIAETVAGRKVHVHVGYMSLKLNAEQIVKVIK